MLAFPSKDRISKFFEISKYQTSARKKNDQTFRANKYSRTNNNTNNDSTTIKKGDSPFEMNFVIIRGLHLLCTKSNTHYQEKEIFVKTNGNSTKKRIDMS